MHEMDENEKKKIFRPLTRGIKKKPRNLDGRDMYRNAIEL